MGPGTISFLSEVSASLAKQLELLEKDEAPPPGFLATYQNLIVYIESAIAELESIVALHQKKVHHQIHPQVKRLLEGNRGIPQRTPEWLAARLMMLTASEISSALMMTEKACGHYVNSFGLHDTFQYSSRKSCNPYQTRSALIKKKSSTAASELFNGDFMEWGTRYEEVARIVYQQMTGEKTFEFGLLPHPVYEGIGASPDGVTASGKVIEIKVPSVRSPAAVPPLQYFLQMALQMEVCGLDSGDFFDVRIIEWNHESEWLASAMADYDPERSWHTHGIMCQEPQDDGTMRSVYAPEDMKRPQDFCDWVKPLREKGCRVHCYQVIEYELVHVTRDPTWLARNYDELMETLNEIKAARARPVEDNDDECAPPPAKRPRLAKALRECLI